MYIIFRDGIYDYHWVIADAGPIMYPAGHAYLYWLVEKLTFGGSAFYAAILMALLHAFQTYILVRIYEKAGIQSKYCYILLLLFNDRALAVQAL